MNIIVIVIIILIITIIIVIFTRIAEEESRAHTFELLNNHRISNKFLCIYVYLSVYVGVGMR